MTELPLPLWERVGVRGSGLSIVRNPSPGSHLAMRSDLSHRGRGEANGVSCMKKILIIGIGAGDPDYVTMQAVNALNQVDVFFLMDKGESKAELIELRKEICRR